MSLLKTLEIRFLLLFAIVFKIEKELQLYGEQYRKEAMNQCKKKDTKNEAKKLRVTTFAFAKLDRAERHVKSFIEQKGITFDHDFC